MSSIHFDIVTSVTVELSQVPITIIPGELQAIFVLPVLTIMCSVGLDVLVLKKRGGLHHAPNDDFIELEAMDLHWSF